LATNRRKVVEKVTVRDRQCWVCLKWWPVGTHFFEKLGILMFKCPDGRHRP
jgi:hypothetical protein